MEFYHTATVFRASATRFVMSEKNIPKRWRPVFAFPMIKKVNELVDNITAANTIYPVNLHEFEIRRDYQTKAIIVVNQILQLMQYALETLDFNADKLQPLTELLLKEDALLKAWRKSDAKRKTVLEKKERENALPKVYNVLSELTHLLTSIQDNITSALEALSNISKEQE